MKFSRASILFYFALVFVCGGVLGVFGQRLYSASTVLSSSNRQEEFRKKALAEYRSRLKLTDDQVSKMGALMDETRARVGDIRKQMHPLYEKVHQEQTEKVREILNATQREEYDRMLKEREERQKQNGGRGPGPGI
jgi:uncharacterized membrane protein